MLHKILRPGFQSIIVAQRQFRLCPQWICSWSFETEKYLCYDFAWIKAHIKPDQMEKKRNDAGKGLSMTKSGPRVFANSLPG